MFTIHAPVLDRLDPSSSTTPYPHRRRVPSDPCLPSSLPPTSFIQREADSIAPESFRKRPLSSPSPRALEDAMSSPIIEAFSPTSNTTSDATPLTSPSITTSPSLLARLSQKIKSDRRASESWKEPEPYMILAAVEKRDLEFLAQIRDRAFPLLLHNIGHASPLKHAMTIRDHAEVEIFLLGCFSRYVNNLEEDDYLKPDVLSNLKLLKGNLYSAIRHGNDIARTDLIPSYVQVLVMIEGNRWVKQTVAHVAEALRSGFDRQPVDHAESAVRSFTDFQFGKKLYLAALEDFIANATVDLVMMAAASLVGETIKGYPVPPINGFARDSSIYRRFSKAVFKYRQAIEERLNSRLKYQLSTLDDVLAGGSLSWSGKVRVLRDRLDRPPRSN